MTLPFALWGLMVAEGCCWAWRGHQLGLMVPPSLRPTNLGRIEAGPDAGGGYVWYKHITICFFDFGTFAFAVVFCSCANCKFLIK